MIGNSGEYQSCNPTHSSKEDRDKSANPVTGPGQRCVRYDLQNLHSDKGYSWVATKISTLHILPRQDCVVPTLMGHCGLEWIEN
jgi:hypothetical protein